MSEKNLQLIRPSDAAELLSVSSATFFRISKRPDFPDKVHLHKRAVGYNKQEVLNWIKRRTESSHQKPETGPVTA